jgi:hypothetical protein
MSDRPHFRFVISLPYEPSEEDEQSGDTPSTLLGEELSALLEDFGDDVIVAPEPTNDDIDVPCSIEGIVKVMECYTNALRERLPRHPASMVMDEGVRQIEKGVADVLGCIRTLDVINEQGRQAMSSMLQSLGARMGAHVITADNIRQMPTEVIHNLCHQISEQRNIDFPCMELDREGMIKWAIENAQGSEKGKRMMN